MKRPRMNTKIPKAIAPVLAEARKRLKKIFGKRLKAVILYGSYARGDATRNSDIDLIVLLQNVKDPVAELQKCGPEIHRLDFEYDTLISIIPMDYRQFQRRRLPIILNAKKEGIAL